MIRIIHSLIFIIYILGSSFSILANDSTKAESQKFEMKKSPTGAILRSLALPGWGQYYVESYWKVPLFLGAAGTCAYFIIDNNNSFNDKQKQIDRAVLNNPNDPNLQLYKLQRETYRDNRDQAAFFLAGVYILSAVDAFVGAHLFDFDVSDNISMNIFPSKFSMVSLQFSIKISN